MSCESHRTSKQASMKRDFYFWPASKYCHRLVVKYKAHRVRSLSSGIRSTSTEHRVRKLEFEKNKGYADLQHDNLLLFCFLVLVSGLSGVLVRHVSSCGLVCSVPSRRRPILVSLWICQLSGRPCSLHNNYPI